MRLTRRRSQKKRSRSLRSDQCLFASESRVAVKDTTGHTYLRDARGMTQEKAAAEEEARIKAEEELQEQRKLASKDLAGETIRRELAERESSSSRAFVQTNNRGGSRYPT